jgi:hypothetical protein
MKFGTKVANYRICVNTRRYLQAKTCGMNEVLSTMIADAIWNSGSIDVRDLLRVGKLVRCSEDVEWIVRTLQRYNAKN